MLDELNLAPSDVLESLNRLLDDNRELYIPETQETITPHPHFMLFATQNPAGQYGGRKQLSRAFRNRFLELHFSDIPQSELEIILERKCQIPPSYCKKLTSVYKQLQGTRDAARIFDGRHIVTLRDLFRWALRRANGYELLAMDGYMLLAERTRNLEERETIKIILESTMRVKLDPESYYATEFKSIMAKVSELSRINKRKLFAEIVWTNAMQKLFVLVYKATIHCEPVLLVGETGCGKTTICQILAELIGRNLHLVNAHQNSETADFLGSQRPNRNRDQLETKVLEELVKVINRNQIKLEVKNIDEAEHAILELKKNTNEDISHIDKLFYSWKALFEWHDGPLVQAMKNGDFFLLDEISLADDSVLERLNSVLEPERKLVLVEKTGFVQEITANCTFHFFATMNPGGDYGKKELSPALRNRFTEIWVPSISDSNDLIMIMANRLAVLNDANVWAKRIIEFFEWLALELGKTIESIISLRDILAWTNFIVKNNSCDVSLSYIHGGAMVAVDGIGVNPSFGTVGSPSSLKDAASQKLLQISNLQKNCQNVFNLSNEFVRIDGKFGLYPFYITLGSRMIEDIKFSLNAPTTKRNCMRVIRAMQLSKPVLLEGSPGVGKTSLISSLSTISGHELVRINLSEQTDLMDLFGSDLPIENKKAEFAW